MLLPFPALFLTDEPGGLVETSASTACEVDRYFSHGSESRGSNWWYPGPEALHALGPPTTRGRGQGRDFEEYQERIRVGEDYERVC